MFTWIYHKKKQLPNKTKLGGEGMNVAICAQSQFQITEQFRGFACLYTLFQLIPTRYLPKEIIEHGAEYTIPLHFFSKFDELLDPLEALWAMIFTVISRNKWCNIRKTWHDMSICSFLPHLTNSHTHTYSQHSSYYKPNLRASKQNSSLSTSDSVEWLCANRTPFFDQLETKSQLQKERNWILLQLEVRNQESICVIL